MPIELSKVVPWGRSFDEYRRMFALSDADLSGKILGCGDGPASFNAEATAAGRCVTSCDPIYDFTSEQIERRVLECRDDMLAQVQRDRDGFVWDYIRDPEHLVELRIAAMRMFLADFDGGRKSGRYVTASLPQLPFANGCFRLALSSHLLFLYSELLDLEFHLASIEELLRVAAELRCFPLLDLKRNRSCHLEPVQKHFSARGFNVEVVQVAYEFQRAGNQMLRIAHS
jgi:hypothetical protein